MLTLPSDLIPRARQILLPFVTSVDDREVLLTEAFYLHDPLLYRITREGNPKTFSVMCIKTCLDYGCLPDGVHALSRLLITVRYDCGVDKHAEIDSLVYVANALCSADSAPPPSMSDTFPSPTFTPIQTIHTPRQKRQPTIFISYSHEDAEFAKRLIADLNTAGHACWIDTSEIKGGDEWIMTIADGIINSYAFVPIVSTKALESRWVQDEILWARQRNKLIIPLLLEDVLNQKRFFPLVSYQGITVFDSEYNTVLSKLLTYLPSPSLPDVEVNEAEVEDSRAVVTRTGGILTPRTVPRTLELAYLERLKLEELLNTEKYTALGGVTQQRRKPEMRTVFELLPMGREQKHETQQFEDAVAELQRIRRCVLLGEPGGGKTTTLWKLAADLAETTLEDRRAPIPLLTRLGKWTDPEQSLPNFITSQLGDLGVHLDTLLAEKRASLLLDGLNELPASQRDAKYPQVQAFIEAHPDLLAVVSCRELDYTIDLGFDRINITPLDPIRIQEFVTKYLGVEAGDDLFRQLIGEYAHRLEQDFLDWEEGRIHAPHVVFWLSEQLPDGLEWGYKNSDWQRWIRERELPSNLLVLARNPYMLLMLTSAYARQGELPNNRGELFREFVETLLEREAVPGGEREPLVIGLTKVAYEMQIRRAEGDTGDALTVLPQDDVKAILGERLLYLAASASILSVGEQVRFTHQLLQEYFAARYMDAEIKAGRLHAATIWSPTGWWERTNWEEAAILLAGLYSDDPTPVVKWLMDAQPEIAAQCITRSGASAPPYETLLKLRESWLPRLTNLESDPDPKARAAIGRALGQLRLSSGESLDNRAGLSVIVRDGVILPDIDWGEPVPPGIYPIGHGSEEANSPREFQLTYSYQLAKYPVTYAQFQAFLDAEDGFQDARWWHGLADDEYRRQNQSVPDEQQFKFWNHPRENVSWYDAMAFCRWLSWRLGGGYDLDKLDEWAVRLPTETEWEIAARGTDGRVYPYEGDFNAAKGNTDETGIRQTSAVGMFPDGASPYGLLDMSGNVWEWCLTELEAASENLHSNVLRGVRGGSWFVDLDFARAVFRHWVIPYDRDVSLGFRVCRPPSR